MKIGVRAHDYGKMEIEALAKKLRLEGYKAAQLALPKAFLGIDSYEDITLWHLEQIHRAFEENHVEIPVFGCYMDVGNPDAAVRKRAVDTLKKCLAYSKELGAGMVGTETAYPRLSKEEKKIWYPFMMDSIQRVAEEAVKLDVKLAIEPVYWHPLDSIEAALDVIEAVGDKNHLRFIFDPANLLEFPDIDQETHWKKWLSAIGSYIDVMHMKDFKLDDKGNYCPTLLGKGVIQYQEISRWIHADKPNLYLLREEMQPQFAKEDLAFLRAI